MTRSVFSPRIFADVGVGVAFAHQGFGDFRQLGGVFHAFGHVGAVEIGAQADVVGADEFYGVVDVLDDLFPGDVGEFAFGGQLFFAFFISRSKHSPSSPHFFLSSSRC